VAVKLVVWPQQMVEQTSVDNASKALRFLRNMFLINFLRFDSVCHGLTLPEQGDFWSVRCQKSGPDFIMNNRSFR
jgi:hypothetical protein